VREQLVHPLRWLGLRDRDLAALRRAGRAAIVMPAVFAFCEEVIGDATSALFAAFGSFAMLVMVDFRGPMLDRLRNQATLVVACCALICLGTLVSQSAWLAAATMAVVGFVVLFVSVVSSVLAGATTALLLAFVLPATLSAPVSSLPDRLAGWAMAGAASLLAVGLLWPAPTRGPLLSAATAACRALAARMRTRVASLNVGEDEQASRDYDRAVSQASEAVAALHRGFLATPYQPTSLSTGARAIWRLVYDLYWLDAIIVRPVQHVENVVSHAARAVLVAAAAVLERGADLLERTGASSDALHAALDELADAMRTMDESATADLPARLAPDAYSPAAIEQQVSEFITSLDPSFHAQEIGFAVSLIGDNIDLAAAAERRSWLERLLGRQPKGLAGTLSAAQKRASTHMNRRSVWLHNSVRGAIGLGIAVYVADRTGAQHAFWVALGTLSVLRSNALSTGQSALRAMLGTVAGFIVGAAMLALIGTDTTLLWFLLPLAIFLTAVTPAAISFVAGQASFTLMVVFLFNILAPTGWRVGLYRVEDVALGCAVSLLVGALFWPRGAGAALRRALSEAYADSADYLARAVDFGMRCCEVSSTSPAAPTDDAARATAATQRLDGALRGYLAERGAKPVPLAEVTRLVTGVVSLRLAADAILDLWQQGDGAATGDRAAARHELTVSSELVKRWYEDLAVSLANGGEPREPLPDDTVAGERLAAAVRRDLRGNDRTATATAVRMIWTGDHLDAVRRLQELIVGPARVVAER
jgi:Fusaric acid resistance protein-like